MISFIHEASPMSVNWSTEKDDLQFLCASVLLNARLWMIRDSTAKGLLLKAPSVLKKTKTER